MITVHSLPADDNATKHATGAKGDAPRPHATVLIHWNHAIQMKFFAIAMTGTIRYIPTIIIHAHARKNAPRDITTTVANA